MKVPPPMIQEGRVLADWVTNSLREAIQMGYFDPGEKLDQDAIAEAWGVSRTPIREAVRRLESEGFLEVQPHRGAFILQFSEHDIAEVYLVRRLLETEVIRQITHQIPEQEIDELDMVVKASQLRYEDGQRSKYLEFDVRFHSLIMRHAPSPLIKRILKGLDTRSTLTRRVALHFPTDENHVLLSIQEHQAIVRALRARDSEAAALAMERHLLNSAKRIQSVVTRH